VSDGARPSLVRGFAELTLESRDPAALERFYRDFLGLAVLAREDDRVWLAVGERARLGLWPPGRKEYGDEGGSHVHFAFSAAPGDLDAIAERLHAAAHDHRGPVEHEGGDRSLYVEDPEGNVVEIWDAFERGAGARERAAHLPTRNTPGLIPFKDPMPAEFSLSSEQLDDERDVVAVAVAGEIDLFTAPELKAALTEAVENGRTRIVVDLSETTFLDSTALGVLIGAVKRLRSNDGALSIVNRDATIAKTFEITGLDQIFTIRPTREEAIAALDAGPAAA